MRRAFEMLMILFLAALVVSPVGGFEKIYRPRTIVFEVVSDERGVLPMRSLAEDRYFSRSGPCYIEVLRGERYSIRFRNDSSRWVGVVLAVDGRNVISGKPTSLSSDESMYVLRPFSEGVCRGWRSGMDSVQRFYFTDAEDSYAGSWGDYSAMGTIGVAVFAESRRFVDDRVFLNQSEVPYGGVEKKSLKPSPSRHEESACYPMQSSRPGTGYGNSTYSPVTEIDFRPESQPFEKIVVHYQWDQFHREPPKIFFPQEDSRFAPPPRK